MFGRGIRIFTAFGLPIRLDPSWFIILFLIVWSLAGGWFPSVLPDRSPGAYLLLGAIGALGLFASVLAHELGHAAVARREGVPMRGITLFLFGGVAELGDEPPGPGAEFRIAIAGPLVSLAIGLACLGLRSLSASVPGAQAAFAYLGVVNLMVLAFNLLPGFPLDGGRVLRAYLWRRRGTLLEATRTASRVGGWVGAGIVGLGVLEILVGAFFGGVWLVLIGFFLRGAAQTTLRQAQLRRLLAGQPIRRFINDAIAPIGPEVSLDALAGSPLYPLPGPAFPVIHDDRLLGCVRLGRVAQLTRGERSEVTVGQLMEPCPSEALVESDTDALEVVTRSSHAPARVLVVDQNGSLLGGVSIADLIRRVSFGAELLAAGSRPADLRSSGTVRHPDLGR